MALTLANKPIPCEKKTRFPRSTGVRCSRARCSLIEKSDRNPVFFYRLEWAYRSGCAGVERERVDRPRTLTKRLLSARECVGCAGGEV
jgi:hypothetical protein